MKRYLVCGLAAAVLSLLTGCGGGGGGQSDTLRQLSPGMQWVFQYTGTVKLPASLGGGTQNVTADSTLTYSVSSTTSHDLNNDVVNILERKFNLTLLDGRTITANLRQYFTQTERGIYVHGFNNYVDNQLDSANDKWVPSTVVPPYAFLYLPSPVSGTVSYPNPFNLSGSGDHSYQFAVTNTKRLPVDVPAGHFDAMTGTITEKYSDGFALTAVGLVPEVVGGFVSATVKITFPDGTELNGSILLKHAG